jgi:hypothetical protein
MGSGAIGTTSLGLVISLALQKAHQSGYSSHCHRSACCLHGVLVALDLSHLLNDTVQSLIPAVYPLLKARFELNFAQIEFITLTFQIAQPGVGLYTDRNPLPYSTVVGLVFTFFGLIGLAHASSYLLTLVSVTFVGIGSSIFHPEATRSARATPPVGNRVLRRAFFRLAVRPGVPSVLCSQLSLSCLVGRQVFNGSH